MKKKEFKKGMSLFLSILMIFTMIPATVFNIGAEEIYPVMKAFNAASGDDFHKYYRQVYTVTFLDEIDTDAMNGALESWDVSADSDGSVMSWMYLNEEATAAAGQDRYDVYVAGDGGVCAHENTTHMFYVFSSLKEVKGMENFHTGNVKSFLYWFGNCNELESIDLSYLDTSSATTLRFCFYACYKLKEINASTWNTSNITTLERMFYRCYALESADLSGWDTSNITNMLGVFEMTPPTNVSPDYALKSVDLTGWDTSNVTTMENMFKNCEALTELDLSSFDTSKVTSMRFMFYYCKQLKNIYVGDGWTTEAIKNINDGVFNCCYALVGGTDDQAENEQIYNDKHPSAYYPPNVEYAKFKEDGGYLTNVSQKPEEKKYTVTYEFIGDVLPENVTAPDSAVYTEGATVTVADNSSAEHYIFSGWSTQDATVENGQFVINNDVHFVGSWTRLYKVEYKYSEDFIVPEGAPEIPDTELWYAAGEDVPLYGVPYVHGYIFVGWYTDDADVAGDGFTMQDNDVTLYGYFKKPVESVEIINNGDVVINKGEKDKINVYVKPEDATIKDIIYESSDESVVIIDKYGNVEAVGEGTATVTVYSKDDPTKSDTVTVTVKTFVTDVEVDKNDILLNKGETDKITATVTPDDATNKEVTYESGDETVVKVDENGNITAVGEGTTTITVASKDDPTVKEEVTVTVKIPVTEVTAGDDFTLNIGEEKNVDASVNEDATNKELIYESDNPGVVKVDSDGNVIAVGEGTATITVTSKDDPTKKETVTVTVKRPVEDIIVDNSEIELEIGETDKITVTVTPDNATNKEVTYESGDETVVKVDEKGNITAVGEGTTTITVTSKDDPSIKETVEITVRKPVVDVEDIIIDKDEIELEIGQTDKITVTVTPDDATNKEVTYESGDETVVKVDEKGNITAVGEGTTTITVTSKDDPSIKETVEITVRKPEPVKVPVTEVVIEKDNIILGENENTVLDVRVNPENATNKELTFESSNENVVKVDENGKITAVGEGTATVTVTSKDDPSKKDTVTVTVVKREVEYNIIAPDKLSLYVNEAKNLGARVEPSEGAPAIKYSSADESIVKVDENGNVIAVGVGSTTVTLDLGNGTVKVIPVVVLPAPAAPVIPVKHHVCFGKTDGIGWYEVSVNGGDFFPQGPNSTLEVENGSVLVVRVQDMWIDDEFDFYVNGKKVAMDPANTITVVVDGYMLIGALSMDVEVPDVEESLTLFEKILKAIKDFFDWLFGRR